MRLKTCKRLHFLFHLLILYSSWRFMEFLLACMHSLPMAGECFGLWAYCLTECGVVEPPFKHIRYIRIRYWRWCDETNSSRNVCRTKIKSLCVYMPCIVSALLCLKRLIKTQKMSIGKMNSTTILRMSQPPQIHSLAVSWCGSDLVTMGMRQTVLSALWLSGARKCVMEGWTDRQHDTICTPLVSEAVCHL